MNEPYPSKCKGHVTVREREECPTCTPRSITSKKLTLQVVQGMRARHAEIENASDKLAASRDMAYLSHLDRAELLGEVERLNAEVTEAENEARAANVRADRIAADWTRKRAALKRIEEKGTENLTHYRRSGECVVAMHSIAKESLSGDGSQVETPAKP